MKPDNIIAICEYILDKTRNDIDNPTLDMLSELLDTLNRIEKDLSAIKSQLIYTPQIDFDSDDLPF